VTDSTASRGNAALLAQVLSSLRRGEHASVLVRDPPRCRATVSLPASLKGKVRDMLVRSGGFNYGGGPEDSRVRDILVKIALVAGWAALTTISLTLLLRVSFL
jgi:hypothetical protein